MGRFSALVIVLLKCQHQAHQLHRARDQAERCQSAQYIASVMAFKIPGEDRGYGAEKVTSNSIVRNEFQQFAE